MRGMLDFPWTCEVCGASEARGATFRQSSSAWTGATFVHRDPRVCADNIAREKAAMQKRISELEAAAKAKEP